MPAPHTQAPPLPVQPASPEPPPEDSTPGDQPEFQLVQAAPPPDDAWGEPEPEPTPAVEPGAPVEIEPEPVEPSPADMPFAHPAPEPEPEISYFDLGIAALEAGDTERAIQNLKDAIEVEPTHEEAYYHLALAYEKQQQIAEAVAIYGRLIKGTSNDRWRRLARAREQGLKRKLGMRLLRRAERAAALQQLEDGLDPLEKAAELGLPPGLDCRVRSRYYDYCARLFAARVSEEVGEMSATPVAVAEFVALGPAADEESRAFTDRTFAELGVQRGIIAISRELPPKIVRRLADLTGDIGAQSLLNELTNTEEADWLLVGSLGTRAEVRLFDLLTGRLAVSVCVPRVGPVPGKVDAPIWQRLPARADTNERLGLEVWTDKEVIHEGEPALLFTRVMSDAFVTILAVLPDGTLDVIYPNEAHPDNFVRGGIDFEVPRSAWARLGSGLGLPPGVGGIVAVCTVADIPLVALPELPAATAASPEARQAALVQSIQEKLRALPRESWAESRWTVRILPRQEEPDMDVFEPAEPLTQDTPHPFPSD